MRFFTQGKGSFHIHSESSVKHSLVDVSWRPIVHVVKAALTWHGPAEYGAMPGSTINVIKYDRLVLGWDVFEHFK